MGESTQPRTFLFLHSSFLPWINKVQKYIVSDTKHVFYKYLVRKESVWAPITKVMEVDGKMFFISISSVTTTPLEARGRDDGLETQRRPCKLNDRHEKDSPCTPDGPQRIRR